jgi:hypothetical protein
MFPGTHPVMIRENIDFFATSFIYDLTLSTISPYKPIFGQQNW